MTDANANTEAEAAEREELERIVKVTKKNFDPRERLKRRGLRRATITLFLDEEIGEKLGRDYPITNSMDMVIGHDRTGVLGKLAELAEKREKLVAAHEAELADRDITQAAKTKLKKDHSNGLKALDSIIAATEERRDELIKQLTDTGITLKLRAVPPVIQKDCRRKAKQTLGITEKGIPEGFKAKFDNAEVAHLLASMVESITDNETGTTNDHFDYDDAVAHMEELPPGQWFRLDQKIGELQFTDGISRVIENQEDFS